MDSAFNISPESMKNIQTKGWMTHDAMWFFSCLQEFGIEKTNELNRNAIALMAPIETKRMLKALGMESETFDNFEKFWKFFSGARQFVIPEWMDFSFTSPKRNIARWECRSCFAYDGVKRIGALDGYHCGVMFRIESWIKTLGIQYEMKPNITGCLMHETGKCEGEFHFHFDGKQ